jgi:hypothetical protein
MATAEFGGATAGGWTVFADLLAAVFPNAITPKRHDEQRDPNQNGPRK